LIGLEDYLRLEGIAYRLVPEKKQNVELINEDLMRKNLLTVNPGYSETYQTGFKYRGLNDNSIFYDDNQERLVQNYRMSFLRFAAYYQSINQNSASVEVLNKLEQYMPHNVVKLDYRLVFDISNMYYNAGAMDKYKIFAEDVEKEALKKLEENPTDVSSYYNPYRILISIYDKLEEYDKAIDILTRLDSYYPNDASIKGQLDLYKAKRNKK
jgi:tetratricopeptide (TPR) repeat protein